MNPVAAHQNDMQAKAYDFATMEAHMNTTHLESGLYLASITNADDQLLICFLAEE